MVSESSLNKILLTFVQLKLLKPCRLKQILHQNNSETINAHMEWLTLLPMKAKTFNLIHPHKVYQ